MWCFGGGVESLLEKNNFLFVVVNLFKCYWKMPMVSKSFFFEIIFFHFMVAMRTSLLIERGPHCYHGLIFMCF